jgi:ATP-dependent Clp protease adapter protein ClpS
MSQSHPDRRESPEPAARHPQPTAGDKPSRRTIPQYKIVLLQDSQSDMMFIVRTIMEITRLCRAEATHKMWEAHHGGRSVLLTTYRERAELLAEQLSVRGLKVTLEAA